MNKAKNFKSICFALLLAWFPVFWAQGATWLVATNGSDSADGQTWGTAFATISNAIANATTDGDTVLVSNGTYQIYAALEITNGITVTSVNGADVTIVDAGSRSGVGCFRVLHADAVLEGFTATRGYTTSPAQLSAGLHMSAGTVRWCRFINNRSSNLDGSGGGSAKLTGGIMHHCVIQDGQYGIYNGTIYLSGDAILRNCLVTDNYFRRGGGVYIVGSSRVENCTVVRNRGGEHTGGIYRGGGTVVNTVVYHNTDPTVDYNNWRGATGFYYSCSTPLPVGEYNLEDDPLLVDLDNRDYHLLPGSPMIGAGTTNLAWLADNPGEVDLDGNPRVVGGSIDIGAYQYTPGPLECGFSADPIEGLAPLDVQFTSVVGGLNTNGLTYYWDFDSDGTIDSFDAHPVYAYAPGVYTVMLTVSNAAGEGAYYERLDYIKAGPVTNFVSITGSHTFPYDTWETAANDIASAVDAAVDGTLIRVADGLYTHTATIQLLKGVTIRSENGRDATIVRLTGGDGIRSLYLSHPDVLVDGLTLVRNPASGYGGGVQIHNFGVIENCDILGGRHNNIYGGNVTINAGVVRNCFIRGGHTRSTGGFSLSGSALMENCVIVGNTNYLIVASYAVGGGVISGGAVMRNCLVADNYGVGFAGGVRVAGGLVENCTIVGNMTDAADASASGGIRQDGGTIRNTIVMFNKNLQGGSHTNWFHGNGVIEYSCTQPSAEEHGTNNLALVPLFVNMEEGDFTPAVGSPVIHKGLNAGWMLDAKDLAGEPRISGKIVDMGAYEYQVPPGTFIYFR